MRRPAETRHQYAVRAESWAPLIHASAGIYTPLLFALTSTDEMFTPFEDGSQEHCSPLEPQQRDRHF